MSVYNARTERQPDTRSFTDRLCRKEWFEDSAADLFGHARPVVSYGQFNLLTVEAGPNPDAARRCDRTQRLPRIDNQVRQDLMDLVGIGGNHREVLCQVEFDPDICRAQLVRQ